MLQAPGLLSLRGWESRRDRANTQTIGRNTGGLGKGQNSRGRWWQRLKQRGSEAPEIGSCRPGSSRSQERRLSRVGCEGQEAGSRGSISHMPSQLGTNPQGWMEPSSGTEKEGWHCTQGQRCGVLRASYRCLLTLQLPCTCHHHPRNPGPLPWLLPPSSSAVTHLGCCSRWSWCSQVEAGVDKGMGQGPGRRSCP